MTLILVRKFINPVMVARNIIINWRARCRHKSPGQGHYIMSNKSNSTTKAAPMTVKSNGKGKAQDAKTPSIDDIKKVLDDQISKFNRKAELISNRETFTLTKERLLGYKSDIGADYNESLDSEVLRISLENNARYSSNDTKLKIANTMIVMEFIDFAIAKIDKKVAEIEKEIIG